MNWRKFVWTYIAIASLSILILLVAILIIFYRRGTRISHQYRIDEKREIIVDNWDCGATCNFNTKVYIETDSWYGKNNKTLLSCKGVEDIGLREIGKSSAIIDYMNGRAVDNEKCPHKEGDTIYYKQ